MRNIVIIGLSLMFHSFIGFTQTVDEGTINGADYVIIIPANWNNSLVMYAHGYESIGEEIPEEEEDNFPNIFTDRGFAYAASSFKKQGMAIKEGVEDTEALRSYFEMKYGKPELCIITGHSMGGIISIATIEKYPAEYHGALPLCGWLAPVYSLFKRGFDMLVTYDYLFGDNDGKIVSDDEYIEKEVIEERLNMKPELIDIYAEHFGLRKENLADAIEFNQFVLKESVGWMGGMPVTNQKTIYGGFGDKDPELNKNIRRYDAHEGALEFLTEYYTPTGLLRDPVLALHTSYDEILPVNNYEYYEQATLFQNTQDLYAQQYVIGNEHCWFEDEEIAKVFDQLLIWIREGTYPEWEKP